MEGRVVFRAGEEERRKEKEEKDELMNRQIRRKGNYTKTENKLLLARFRSELETLRYSQ
jgi:hypothetical protein